MRKGKTKYGVDIKSTRGMISSQPIRWFLVADGATAKLFCETGTHYDLIADPKFLGKFRNHLSPEVQKVTHSSEGNIVWLSSQEIIERIKKIV